MMYPHQDPEFSDLVSMVAAETGLSEAIIEKDYWVTHTLWALHQLPLEIWFKGGTSLSKGFGLITRFSEDVDLRIEPASNALLTRVSNWKSKNPGVIRKRHEYFASLLKLLKVPDATDVRLEPGFDDQARGALYLVDYPGVLQHRLPEGMRPYIQLEVGHARVEPFIERSLSSFIHDWLRKNVQIDTYRENLPHSVRCVHPLVTALEKIDAIIRRFDREPFEPALFIRHYEDTAHIIRGLASIPPAGFPIRDLMHDMYEKKQISRIPTGDEPAFELENPDKLPILLHHYQSISPMFWGERLSLEDACETIRNWIRSELA